MMTMDKVRAIAEMVRVHDQAIEWRESFDDDKQLYIQFGEITGRRQIDGMGEGRGWDGDLIVPRTVAIEMMRWLERYVLEALQKSGVKP